MADKTVLVTGGAGYVGGVLVPKLLEEGYKVRVLDLYLYEPDALKSVQGHLSLEEIKGDIRDQELLKRILPGCDSVIHLACISNDPSFELDPPLSRAINYDAFQPLVKISKESGISRFIYASTSSVYGVSEVTDVTEDHPLMPLTDYNKFKGMCEPLLMEHQSSDFTTVTIRPATICGYSPRQRLDLTVNILTNLAINTGQITVFGGTQCRPNLHIEDMVEVYLQLLKEPDARIAGQVYNVGYQNLTVSEIAEIVGSVVSKEVPGRESLETVTTESDDLRSYHISSEKIHRELGFRPVRTIESAVHGLCLAFAQGRLPGPLTDSRYFNVRRMQETKLT